MEQCLKAVSENGRAGAQGGRQDPCPPRALIETAGVMRRLLEVPVMRPAILLAGVVAAVSVSLAGCGEQALTTRQVAWTNGDQH